MKSSNFNFSGLLFLLFIIGLFIAAGYYILNCREFRYMLDAYIGISFISIPIDKIRRYCRQSTQVQLGTFVLCTGIKEILISEDGTKIQHERQLYKLNKFFKKFLFHYDVTEIIEAVRKALFDEIPLNKIFQVQNRREIKRVYVETSARSCMTGPDHIGFSSKQDAREFYAHVAYKIVTAYGKEERKFRCLLWKMEDVNGDKYIVADRVYTGERQYVNRFEEYCRINNWIYPENIMDAGTCERYIFPNGESKEMQLFSGKRSANKILKILNKDNQNIPYLDRFPYLTSKGLTNIRNGSAECCATFLSTSGSWNNRRLLSFNGAYCFGDNYILYDGSYYNRNKCVRVDGEGMIPKELTIKFKDKYYLKRTCYKDAISGKFVPHSATLPNYYVLYKPISEIKQAYNIDGVVYFRYKEKHICVPETHIKQDLNSKTGLYSITFMERAKRS